MNRIATIALSLLLLVSYPATAAVSDEDFAELIVRQVTLEVTVKVTNLSAEGSIWEVPYDVIEDFAVTLDESIGKVDALRVPECLSLWLDTVRLSLRMLSESVTAVGHAAHAADDIDRAIFAATGPKGYELLTDTAPALLAVAACPVVGDPTVA
jgi:hypothetical protein